MATQQAADADKDAAPIKAANSNVSRAPLQGLTLLLHSGSMAHLYSRLPVLRARLQGQLGARAVLTERDLDQSTPMQVSHGASILI